MFPFPCPVQLRVSSLERHSKEILSEVKFLVWKMVWKGSRHGECFELVVFSNPHENGDGKMGADDDGR